MQKAKTVTLTFGLLLFIILALTGCGANISTKLTVDDSFAGSRQIVCTVSKNDVNEYFKGGVAKIDEIINNKCPSELTYTKSEDEANYVYTFELTFSSKDDYEAKLEKILERKPNVTFTTPNTLFVKGFCITEDFNSQDILGWFKKAVEEEKLMDDISNLWEIGETAVEYAGITYKTNGNISLNQIEYKPIEKIVFTTKQEKDGIFSRDISIYIPSETLQMLSAEIEDYMSNRVPQDGKGEWITNDYGKEFKISFTAESAEELASKTSTALDSKNNTASLKDDMENSTAFKTQTLFEEALDCSAFVSDSSNNVNIDYKYITSGGEEISFVQKESNGEWQDVSYLYDNGIMSFSDDINICLFRIGIEKQYLINKVNIIMKQNDNNRYERSIIFEYDQSASIEGAELAKKYFDGLNAPHTKTTAQEKDGIIKCTVNITGSSEEITAALKKLFGEGNSLTYFRQKGLLKVKKSTLMTDNIDMVDFLQKVNYNNTINYCLVTKGKEVIKGIAFEADGRKDLKSIGKSKEQFSDELPGYNVKIKYNGSVFSPIAVLFICLIIIIALILIIFAALPILKAISRKLGEINISYKDTIINLMKSIKSKGIIIIQKSLVYTWDAFGKMKVNINAAKTINEPIEDIVIPKTKVKVLRIVKYLLLFAMVCFFFPFFTVSCGTTANSITFNGWTSTFGTIVNTGFSTEKIDGNLLCILLLLLPVASFIILTIKSKLSEGINFIICSLSSLISVIELIAYRIKVIEKIEESGYGSLDLKFEWGYKLSLIVHIAIFIITAYASFIIFTRNRNTKSDTVQNEQIL